MFKRIFNIDCYLTYWLHLKPKHFTVSKVAISFSKNLPLIGRTIKSKHLGSTFKSDTTNVLGKKKKHYERNYVPRAETKAFSS